MDIMIDKEFESICRKLTDDEYDILERSIIETGCRESILLWDGNIIDGHNRYSICNLHNVPFKTSDMNFETRESVMLWMINNQLGRRNLSDLDRVQLLERKRPILEEQARGRMETGINQHSPKVNLPEGSKPQVRDQLASEAGISGKTYAALKTVNEKGSDELKVKVRSKEIGASKAAKIAVLPKESQLDYINKEIEKKKETRIAAAKKQKQPEGKIVTSYTAPDDEQGEDENQEGHWSTSIDKSNAVGIERYENLSNANMQFACMAVVQMDRLRPELGCFDDAIEMIDSAILQIKKTYLKG